MLRCNEVTVLILRRAMFRRTSCLVSCLLTLLVELFLRLRLLSSDVPPEALPDDRRLLREDVRRLRFPDELVALLHEC